MQAGASGWGSGSHWHSLPEPSAAQGNEQDSPERFSASSLHPHSGPGAVLQMKKLRQPPGGAPHDPTPLFRPFSKCGVTCPWRDWVTKTGGFYLGCPVSPPPCHWDISAGGASSCHVCGATNSLPLSSLQTAAAPADPEPEDSACLHSDA